VTEVFSDTLLAWYDTCARELPWRISPQDRANGVTPDPYRVWLSEIMLQQTTVVAVRQYYVRFTTRWPSVAALAAASDGDVMAEWAGLGYYARARNLLKCARIVADDFGGRFPDTYVGLLKLPGIGPYTAAAIAAIAYDLPAAVVDTNVKRVLTRVFAVHKMPDQALPILQAHARRLTPKTRAGDYAQAIMDLGATVCSPKNPACDRCPCAAACRANAQGLVGELPRKAAKVTKPTRYGVVYVARRSDGAWLLERRPASGLLGGMLGWPTSSWDDDPVGEPPIAGDWREQDIAIRHTFTHFHLHLTVQTLVVGIDARPSAGTFIPDVEFRRSDLPTLMRKAYDAAVPVFEPD